MTKDPFKYFRIEARELLDGLAQGTLELEKGRGGAEPVVKLLRLAHTLKGASRVVKLGPIAEIAHAVEDVLAPFRDGTSPVTKDAVASLLRHLDGIRIKLRELDAPAAPGPAPAAPSPAPESRTPTPAPAVAPSGEVFETVRIELSEMDSFLDAVTEIGTQGGSLRAGLRRVQRGGVLAHDLHRRMSARGAAAETSDELRRELRGAHRH